jgi:hypothetical protein
MSSRSASAEVTRQAVTPSQSVSTPSKHTSVAPGWIPASASSQSVLPATYEEEGDSHELVPVPAESP